MPSIFDRLLLAFSEQLRNQQATVTALQAQMESVMATQQDFDDRISLLDDATTEVASDLQAVRDELAELKANGASIPDSVISTLDVRIARLQAMGKDPENPIPATRAADSDNIVWST